MNVKLHMNLLKQTKFHFFLYVFENSCLFFVQLLKKSFDFYILMNQINYEKCPKSLFQNHISNFLEVVLMKKTFFYHFHQLKFKFNFLLTIISGILFLFLSPPLQKIIHLDIFFNFSRHLMQLPFSSSSKVIYFINTFNIT